MSLNSVRLKSIKIHKRYSHHHCKKKICFQSNKKDDEDKIDMFLVNLTIQDPLKGLEEFKLRVKELPRPKPKREYLRIVAVNETEDPLCKCVCTDVEDMVLLTALNRAGQDQVEEDEGD